MAKIPIFPGSSSFFPGDTPFGFYDNEVEFQKDADKITVFCARRLANNMSTTTCTVNAFVEATPISGPACI